ncbi:MAG: hypothetical protein IJG13_06380, partial [Kiritimatiellae bacterium]|nr:hypothetical protein [Kiritimatiellia bacterium]
MKANCTSIGVKLGRSRQINIAVKISCLVASREYHAMRIIWLGKEHVCVVNPTRHKIQTAIVVKCTILPDDRAAGVGAAECLGVLDANAAVRKGKRPHEILVVV